MHRSPAQHATAVSQRHRDVLVDGCQPLHATQPQRLTVPAEYGADEPVIGRDAVEHRGRDGTYSDDLTGAVRIGPVHYASGHRDDPPGRQPPQTAGAGVSRERLVGQRVPAGAQLEDGVHRALPVVADGIGSPVTPSVLAPQVVLTRIDRLFEQAEADLVHLALEHSHAVAADEHVGLAAVPLSLEQVAARRRVMALREPPSDSTERPGVPGGSLIQQFVRAVHHRRAALPGRRSQGEHARQRQPARIHQPAHIGHLLDLARRLSHALGRTPRQLRPTDQSLTRRPGTQ